MVRIGFINEVVFDIGLEETLGKVVSVVGMTSTVWDRFGSDLVYQSKGNLLGYKHWLWPRGTNLHKFVGYLSRSLLLSKFKNTAVAYSFPQKTTIYK